LRVAGFFLLFFGLLNGLGMALLGTVMIVRKAFVNLSLACGPSIISGCGRGRDVCGSVFIDI
jgi:hypothetical protein